MYFQALYFPLISFRNKKNQNMCHKKCSKVREIRNFGLQSSAVLKILLFPLWAEIKFHFHLALVVILKVRQHKILPNPVLYFSTLNLQKVKRIPNLNQEFQTYSIYCVLSEKIRVKIRFFYTSFLMPSSIRIG